MVVVVVVVVVRITRAEFHAESDHDHVGEPRLRMLDSAAAERLLDRVGTETHHQPAADVDDRNRPGRDTLRARAGLHLLRGFGFALDVVLGALVERGFAARTIAVGSMGGVAAAERGECDLAPVHLVDPATARYNVHLLRPGLALVKGWQRMQGFMHRRDDARFAGCSATDAIKAALGDPGCLMVNRNTGAGTRVLIDRLLGGARPPGYSNQPRSHNAVAAAVAQKRADWGRRERAGLAAFLEALRDEMVREKIRALGMHPAEA